MSVPRVSVICPTYNRSTAIRDTIDSVLAQSFKDWELLVVSDGSTDDTDDVVQAAARRDRRVRLVRTSAHGDPSEPRNLGLGEARGDVVAYLDHDDRYRTDHLERVVALIDAGAELIAMGNVYRDLAGAVQAWSADYTMCWHPELQLLSAVFETSRVSHRRELVDEAGGWREVLGFEDWDLWQRMADQGHRFTTQNERTVLMQARQGSRRHSLRARYRLPLVLFDDAESARHAVRLLADRAHEAALRRAALADMRDWLTRLVESGEFVRPLGWDGDPVAEHLRFAADTAAPGVGLVVTRHADGFAVTQPLFCATPEHAARIVAVTHRDRTRLLAEFRAVTRHLGPREVVPALVPATR
ncbi:MAG: glycosyltransferase [Promicromonosporaceae bacterium]|nr:glycosyltransferase [Promicromonosporaceae bacterium]